MALDKWFKNYNGGRSGRSRTYDVSNVGLLQSLAIATMHTDRYNLLLDY